MAEPAAGSRARELRSLTGLRAFAALFVFAFHTSVYGSQSSSLWHVVDVGFAGVSFFFVLSGVVLTWAFNPAIRAATFYRRRFARIYPAHLVMSVVAIVLYLRWAPNSEPVGALLLTLLLLQSWVPSRTVIEAGNGVSWSLSCEMFFYLCFPRLLRALMSRKPAARIKIAAAGLTVTAGAALAASFIRGGRYELFVYSNPLARLGEFLLGVVIGLALKEGWRPQLKVRNAWLALLVAWSLSLWLGELRGWPPYRGVSDVLVLIPFALLIVAYAGVELGGGESMMGRPIVVYLGRISFAFYLVHQLMLGVVVHDFPWRGASVGASAVETVEGFVLSLVAAIALHHLVEVPCQRRLGRVRPMKSETQPVAEATSQRAIAHQLPGGPPVVSG